MKPTGPLTWTPPAYRRAFSKALIMELKNTTSRQRSQVGCGWVKKTTVNCWEKNQVCSWVSYGKIHGKKFKVQVNCEMRVVSYGKNHGQFWFAGEIQGFGVGGWSLLGITITKSKWMVKPPNPFFPANKMFVSNFEWFNLHCFLVKPNLLRDFASEILVPSWNSTI